MTEGMRITDLMDRAFHGTAWHGPAVMELLKDMSAATALARPLTNVHTIWELVLHMATWKDVARWRLEGNEKVPGDEENFPPVTDTSENAWHAARERLNTAHNKLKEAVTAAADAKLEEEIPAGGGLTHFVRLHGVIHHDLYHAGQIAILKKLAG
ncbi:DinB family protein [bacterium]|nr:DinB family protein [bacterium]MBU1982884.1 DinB family protein [bacterium]